MSIQVNSTSRFLNLLHEAVLVNTVRPREEEMKKITVSKMIRCSPEVEGDSQLGTMLFIGIAHSFRVPQNEIIDFLGIEVEEYQFKLNKYIKHYLEAKKLPPMIKSTISFDLMPSSEFDRRKLIAKIKLITNYIREYARQNNVLISVA